MVNKSVFPPRGYPNHSFVLGLFCVLALLLDACAAHAQSTGLRVGAAVAELSAEDTMEIGGSILPGKVTGQEGKLRAVAVVLEKRPYPKVAIVACDVLMLTRDLLDPVVAEIEKTSGIPAAGVLINCTHTHHAPSTVRVHGYGRDEKFCAEVQRKTIEVFRKMRRERMAQQGQERTTWLQAMVIGDVAIVGVPAEFFTKFGIDIKNRSPYRHTYVAELANDWIGFVPDRDAFQLGGYQVWTGFHSYCEAGTGERIVEEVVGMLKEMATGGTADESRRRP